MLGLISMLIRFRELLMLRCGLCVVFYFDPQGRVILLPLYGDIRELRGSVRSPHKRPVTVEEMNEAIARGWSGT